MHTFGRSAIWLSLLVCACSAAGKDGANTEHAAASNSAMASPDAADGVGSDTPDADEPDAASAPSHPRSSMPNSDAGVTATDADAPSDAGGMRADADAPRRQARAARDAGTARDAMADADGMAAMDAGGDMPTLGTGSCCAEHDTPGCSNADLQVCVCEKLPSCCTSAWTAACALIVEQKYCQAGVRDCVCGDGEGQWGQHMCCETDWTPMFCNQVAQSKCGAAPGCS